MNAHNRKDASENLLFTPSLQTPSQVYDAKSERMSKFRVQNPINTMPRVNLVDVDGAELGVDVPSGASQGRVALVVAGLGDKVVHNLGAS